jgi:hypothetical protein
MMSSAAPWFSDPSTIPALRSLALEGPFELDRKTGCSWKRPPHLTRSPAVGSWGAILRVGAAGKSAIAQNRLAAHSAGCACHRAARVTACLKAIHYP